MHNEGGLDAGAAAEGVEQLLVRLDLLQDCPLDLLRVLPHRWDGLHKHRPHHLRCCTVVTSVLCAALADDPATCSYASSPSVLAQIMWSVARCATRGVQYGIDERMIHVALPLSPSLCQGEGKVKAACRGGVK